MIRLKYARDNDPTPQPAESGSSCLGKIALLMLVLAAAVLVAAVSSPRGRLLLGLSGECDISARYPDRIQRWCEPITRHALQNDLHPDLVAALIWQESGGDTSAYSRSGAVGLMQVMPRNGRAASFDCQGKPCFQDRPTIRQLQNPEFNIQYGTEMLSDLVASNRGNLREALREYGPIDVGYAYADAVLAIYKRYSGG